MKGAVSKVVSRQCNTLSRATIVGRPLLGGVSRASYHTLAKNTNTVTQPTARYFSPSVKLNVSAVQSEAIAQFLPESKLPREIVWLLGAPGAGKGTNSGHVATARGFKASTIVMSSLLESPECKRIKDAGGMVDDKTVFRALMAELTKPEYRDGVVVDGFPRTKEQAEMLSNMHESLSETSIPPKFTFVMLSLSEEVSIARQLSRGNAISKLNAVRRLSGMAPLEERATDCSEVHARTRYTAFAEQYEAVTKLSSRFSLAVVDADASIEAVRQRLSSAIGRSSRTPRTLRRLQPTIPQAKQLVYA